MRVSLGPEGSEGAGARSEKHIGSSVDDLLNKEGVSEEAQAQAIKEAVAWQLAQAIKKKKTSRFPPAPDSVPHSAAPPTSGPAPGFEEHLRLQGEIRGPVSRRAVRSTSSYLGCGSTRPRASSVASSSSAVSSSVKSLIFFWRADLGIARN